MSTRGNRRYRGSFHRDVYSDAQRDLILSTPEPHVGVSLSTPPSPRRRSLPRPPSSRRRSIPSFPPIYETHVRPLPVRPLPKPPVPPKDSTPELISTETPSGEVFPPPVPPKDRPRRSVLPSLFAATTDNLPPTTRQPFRRFSRSISVSPFRRVLRLAKRIRPFFPVQSPKG